jgi:hypothetical protein
MKVYFEHIHEHIGYLFYAIASEHGKLNAVTFDKLKRVVDQQWYPVSNGISVESNLTNYLQSGMQNAYDTLMTSREAFDLFKSYYDIHSLPFGKFLRSKIFATANTIASESSGNGAKSEFITSLEKLLAVNPIALV